MRISDFDYDLPSEFIAQFPQKVRDHSKLLVLNRNNGNMMHHKFFQIIDYFQENDALVVNNTQVFPARLFGRRKTGGKVEVLLLRKVKGQEDDSMEFSEEWRCLINTSRPMKLETDIFFDNDVKAKILSKKGEVYRIHIVSKEELSKSIEKIGYSPLPPYIKRKIPEEFERLDRRRYQTVYATEEGAVAAPTAGLHFTKSILEQIKKKGVDIIPMTLHINFATFQPVRVDNVENHEMHSEYFKMLDESASRINEIKDQGGKIYAVGTTVVRTLEFLADESGKVSGGEGENNLFIYPGYKFKVVDHLITNFHLPRSTLLMLVSAFGGREQILEAYKEAIRRKYRFYSYGDAMLII